MCYLYIFDKASSTREVVEDGILFKSSIVNTLVKKLFRVSALSFGVIALEPSALVRDGIDCIKKKVTSFHYKNFINHKHGFHYYHLFFYHPATPYISIMESCYPLNNMIMVIFLGSRPLKIVQSKNKYSRNFFGLHLLPLRSCCYQPLMRFYQLTLMLLDGVRKNNSLRRSSPDICRQMRSRSIILTKYVR